MPKDQLTVGPGRTDLFVGTPEKRHLDGSRTTIFRYKDLLTSPRKDRLDVAHRLTERQVCMSEEGSGPRHVLKVQNGVKREDLRETVGVPQLRPRRDR